MGYASYNTYDPHDGGRGPNVKVASCHTRPFNEQHCNALVKSFKNGKITFTQKACITFAVKSAWLNVDNLVQDIQDLHAGKTIEWSEDAVRQTLQVYDGVHRMAANNRRCQEMYETSHAAQAYVQDRQATTFYDTVQSFNDLLAKEKMIGVQLFDMGERLDFQSLIFAYT